MGFRRLLLVLVCMAVFLMPPVHAASADADKDGVIFRDERTASTILSGRMGAWSLEDKQVFLDTLNAIKQRAPGLLQHVSLYAPLEVYRSEGRLGPTGRSIPSYTYGKTTELAVNDYFFFFPSKQNALFDVDLDWREHVLVHELAHLVDAGHKIAYSVEWQKLKDSLLRDPRTFAVKHTQTPVQVCWDMGIPSRYAMTNAKELLAECVAALVLVPPDKCKLPAEVREFVNAKFLSPNPKPDESIRDCYEGWAACHSLHRGLPLNRVSTTDIQTARDRFNAALKIDPNYPEAINGKQLMEIILSDRAKEATSLQHD